MAQLKKADLLQVLDVADIIKEKEELELQRTRLALARENGTTNSSSTVPLAVSGAQSSTSQATQDEKIEEMQKTMKEIQKDVSRIEAKMDAKLDKILAGNLTRVIFSFSKLLYNEKMLKFAV